MVINNLNKTDNKNIKSAKIVRAGLYKNDTLLQIINVSRYKINSITDNTSNKNKFTQPYIHSNRLSKAYVMYIPPFTCNVEPVI